MKSVIIPLLTLFSMVQAAPPVVSNVRASQMPGTKFVDVFYDLADADGDTQTIEARVSLDGGITYSVPATTMMGHVGSGVTVGTDKHLRWDAGADFGGNFIERCKVRITATDGNLPSAPAGMAIIPAGWFQMGDTLDGINSPTANIFVSQFFMDRTEISKAKWDEVRSWAAANGFSDLSIGLSHAGTLCPVRYISWSDAVKWCNARSIKEGLAPCYYTNTAKTPEYIFKTGSVSMTVDLVDWAAEGYRLPTEAEWEKAARGGLVNKYFPWGNTITHSEANYKSYASVSYPYDISPTRGYHPIWYSGTSGITAPCGSFQANGYGLYDMAGNVAEWCWDWSGGTLGTPSSNNPTGPASGGTNPYRSIRGGYWDSSASDCRVNHGSIINSGSSNNIVGLRSVRR